VAGKLKDCRQAGVYIEGYSVEGSSVDDRFNLSKARALSVIKALRGKGLEKVDMFYSVFQRALAAGEKDANKNHRAVIQCGKPSDSEYEKYNLPKPARWFPAPDNGHSQESSSASLSSSLKKLLNRDQRDENRNVDQQEREEQKEQQQQQQRRRQPVRSGNTDDASLGPAQPVQAKGQQRNNNNQDGNENSENSSVNGVNIIS